MKTEKQILGRAGEDLAVNFLKKKNYQILARNWKCRFGELDIVAAKTKGWILKKTESIVFVEVKTIDSTDVLFESQAEQNVNFFKQKKLIKSAQSFLKASRIKPETPWQIDVIAIEYDSEKGLHKIRHWGNAVWQ